MAKCLLCPGPSHHDWWIMVDLLDELCVFKSVIASDGGRLFFVLEYAKVFDINSAKETESLLRLVRKDQLEGINKLNHAIEYLINRGGVMCEEKSLKTRVVVWMIKFLLRLF